ncbi:MAG: UDP-N-acetylglucosamine 1-carboxyvinyltransferase 1 [Firmicutes bacterium ADurb.Bin193]|nr:MAG: UDP-N-acetylglucosamine 1-carboxyvinyltransferase 1 [Firmicutes bacterium ADurb.Bin193]
MGKMIIEGGKRLEGLVRIHGSKNAVLPILAATVLNGGKNVISDCPKLKDVYSSIEILKGLGCGVKWEGSTVIVDSSSVSTHYIPEALMREMRSSIIFLGAIIARCRKATISMPGGCELGPRPIDLHLKAFRQLGISVDESHGYISCNVDKINCDDIHLSFPSVGATENIMLVATLAKGTTTIINAAKEPEIVDLQDYLNAAGAKISGAGSAVITIRGVENLHDVKHTVISDRIVAASYLSAAAITGGTITVTNAIPSHIQPITSVLKDCGCDIACKDDTITIEAPPRPRPIDFIRTLPHPGFPTDAQAPIMSVLSVATGTSIIAENMFENRFKHVAELNRMGADIKVDGRLAVIRGVTRLSGAKIAATDLRGAAALVIAGLNADGVTQVDGLNHLDRGYESFDEGLAMLGANIKRMG